ncbi:hypothetical protein QJQ45_027851 [Haematococcus lacustris]|nr:hypothetical protein QJQ45_027851 [Haematococcus lacustris]
MLLDAERLELHIAVCPAVRKVHLHVPCMWAACAGERGDTLALDVGCAVGGASMELARAFTDVLGIDYSHAFVAAAQGMARDGTRQYEAVLEGELRQTYTASVPTDIDRTRVRFMQGDACDLPKSLPQFDAVLAANLLCRLPDPIKFIHRLPSLDGKAQRSADVLAQLMTAAGFEMVHQEDVPFLIREHANQQYEYVLCSSPAYQVQPGAFTQYKPTFVITHASVLVQALGLETKNGLQRVIYDKQGWNWWSWEGHRVHWVVAGPEDAPPLLLIHGYGASAYHWRYNIPELAKKYRVYAMCLLGFGWSQKALVDYTNGKQWIRQISSFIEEVVASGPVVLAGNSLGGYASLAAAVARPDLVRGVAMLNGAGPFDEPGRPALDPDQPEPLVDRFKNWLAGIGKRVVLYFAFVRAKQPERIKEVLNMVYTNRDMVDDELVDSIVQPAMDPLAAEVFFRINHRTAPPVTLNRLLTRLQAPLLLLWGMRDPWITPSKAEAIMKMYPAASFVPLSQAGHCPHDDLPVETNAALTNWISRLT